MGIQLLCCAHNNEHTRNHDAIRDTFVAIAQDTNFHVGWKQLHAFPSTTFNSFCRRVNIVLTKDEIYTYTNVVIVDPTHVNLFPLILHNSKLCYLWCNSSQRKKLSQLTPHWIFFPFNNWNIWMFTQTSWFVLTWVCQCYLEPKSAKGPSPFCFGYFSLSKNFSYIAKRCKHPPS
jgi:hypothetical protein